MIHRDDGRCDPVPCDLLAVSTIAPSGDPLPDPRARESARGCTSGNRHGLERDNA